MIALKFNPSLADAIFSRFGSTGIRWCVAARQRRCR